MSFWSTLPSDPTPSRDAMLLARLRTGHFGARWGHITSTIPGHTATFRILADALTIDGVRINVSANLQQQIADGLGSSLLTPKLADLLYLQRGITLLPQPGPVTATTQGTLNRSAAVDAALIAAGGRLWTVLRSGQLGPLVQTVGKHWVLTNALLAYPPGTRAANYGWHGWDYDVAVTPGVHVAQGVGTVHPPQHVDASQTCVLVDRTCHVDGRARDLRDVLRDPDVCALASHEGPLQVFRQPGTPVEPRWHWLTAKRQAGLLTGAAVGGTLLGAMGVAAGGAAGFLWDVARAR